MFMFNTDNQQTFERRYKCNMYKFIANSSRMNKGDYISEQRTFFIRSKMKNLDIHIATKQNKAIIKLRLSLRKSVMTEVLKLHNRTFCIKSFMIPCFENNNS